MALKRAPHAATAVESRLVACATDIISGSAKAGNLVPLVQKGSFGRQRASPAIFITTEIVNERQRAMVVPLAGRDAGKVLSVALNEEESLRVSRDGSDILARAAEFRSLIASTAKSIVSRLGDGQSTYATRDDISMGRAVPGSIIAINKGTSREPRFEVAAYLHKGDLRGPRNELVSNNLVYVLQLSGPEAGAVLTPLPRSISNRPEERILDKLHRIITQ